MIIVILSFVFIGAGLKYVDEVFDREVFSKSFALLLAPLVAAVWVLASIRDSASATILLAVLIGALLAGKIDNFVFKGCAIAVLAALLASEKFIVLPVPLIILSALSAIDELGNDYADRNRMSRAIEIFFLHRCGMKLGVLALCAVSVLPWFYLFAFLSMDLAYDFVGMLGARARASVRANAPLSRARSSCQSFLNRRLHKI